MSLRRYVVTALLVPLAVTAAEEKLKIPAVTVQAVSRMAGGVEAGDTSTAMIPMTLVVVNESERALVKPALLLAPNTDFAITAVKPPLPAAIAPFATFSGAFTLRPRQPIAHGRHDVVLVVQYGWSDGKTNFTSAKPATASLVVKRPFEDEAKGLPGGTAALFYLLLPVIPAFFAYQIVDRWRRGERFQIPVFGTEYLLPGFVIGLLVNYFAGARVSRWGVLIAAAVAGAAWPALRWAWESYQWKRWAFREGDDEKTYLRKALLSPWVRRRNLWVTVKSGAEKWGGMRLEQPNGRRILGARLLISPNQQADFDRVKDMVAAAVGNASHEKRLRLVEAVENGTATASRLENVSRGAGKHSEVIAAAELTDFEQRTAVKKDLVEPAS